MALYFGQLCFILAYRSATSVMNRTVHLGYRCNACRARVPVYTFTRSNGNGAQSCTPPVDRQVECPKCHAPRYVAFAEIQSLERWVVAGRSGRHAA